MYQSTSVDSESVAVELRLADGRALRVLGLPALIASKERAGRPKDLAALPVLRATLDEIERGRA